MTEEGYISKAEVLRRTGISYGQFYRWKRMGLIPEAWFHRRSTFTGQATFLPTDKVLPRVERILALKDAHGLDEIAEMLSPDLARKSYSGDELAAMDWIGDRARELYVPIGPADRPHTFEDVLCLTVIEELLAAGGLADEQIALAAAAVKDRLGELGDGADRSLSLLARDGVTVAAVHRGPCLFDKETRILTRLSLDSLIEQIKVRLGGLFQDGG